MSGQRSADDAGDNLGNDGSETIHPHHRNNNNNGHDDNEDHEHGGELQQQQPPGGNLNQNNNLRRRNDSTASGMAGGCSMREGADSVELRGDGSLGHNGSVLGSHHSSRPHQPRINHNTGNNAVATNTNDGLAVFTWGRGEDGQLGLGDTADQDEPTYVC